MQEVAHVNMCCVCGGDIVIPFLRMQTFTSVVDTLFDAIVVLCARLVRGYVYADEGQFAEADVSAVSDATTPFPTPTTDDTPPSFTEKAFVQPLPISTTRGMVMYAGLPHVPLYKNPTIEYDAQIARIPFGAMVIAGEPKGRFYQVAWNDLSGWVLREDLADRATHIYPVFEKGVENGVDAQNTAYVRALIKDEFGLGRSEFPLQAGEYVLYRLWKRGLRIEWPNVRPRVPGAWHTILKGRAGVYVRIDPKVGSLMEYMLDGEIGHIAYVEAVFPDDTISISEVNNPDSGIYNEREIVHAKWKELHPVFIEVV